MFSYLVTICCCLVVGSTAAKLTRFFPSDYLSYYHTTNINGEQETGAGEQQLIHHSGSHKAAPIGWIEYIENSKPEIVVVPYPVENESESSPGDTRSKRNILKEDDITFGRGFDDYTGQPPKPWSKQFRWYRHMQSAFARPVE